MTAEEREVRTLLEYFGYAVTPIPRSQTQRRADLRATCGHEVLIVEVKSSQGTGEIERHLEQYGWALAAAELQRSDTHSKRVREASKQLTATPQESEALRVVAYVGDGVHADAACERFVHTMYGIVDIVDEDDGGAFAVPCYFFDYSDFYRFPEVDAAIVAHDGGGRLLLNPFGRRELLRGTRLHRELAQHGAVADPVDEEARGVAYCADTDQDRKDESAILRYVISKYDLDPKVMTVRWGHLRAIAQPSHPWLKAKMGRRPVPQKD